MATSKKPKRTVSRNSAKQAVDSIASVPANAMLDTSTDFFLLISPGVTVKANGKNITNTLQRTALGGRQIFFQTESTEDRLVPREGVLINGKKAVFMLRIDKDAKPLP